jgi:hypothetical protein
MKVFGISDLHLSSSGEKPMDVFGPAWAGHREKVESNWRAAVGPDDLVLLPGDLSWAMTLDEARPDLDFVGSLPGAKYFIHGNHDFWFSSPARVRAVLPSSMHLVRNDAAAYGRVGICGVRGWLWPGQPDYGPATDEKHWRRSVLRLRLSLDALRVLDWDVAVALFHYPPRGAAAETELTQMVREAGVRYCIYGHLHGENAARAFEGERGGVLYRCVSADHVDFTPAALFEHGG